MIRMAVSRSRFLPQWLNTDSIGRTQAPFYEITFSLPAHNSGHKGTFSRQDGNAKEDVDCNMNIYFSQSFENGWICLLSLMALHLNFSLTYIRSIEFHREIKLICRRGFPSQTTQILAILRCWFADDGQEMYKNLKRTCLVNVLSIKFLFATSSLLSSS